MSTEKIYEGVLRVVENCPDKDRLKTHLDIGAGNGRLIDLFSRRFGVESSALDYTDELMAREGQKVDIADLNKEGLPYDDNQFDIVTATEVVEHLEHYRQVLREIYRVTRPGGLCILTTPNILNINSRFRFMWFGFWNLFGPLPVNHSALYSTGGHINPVSFFYLAHAMMDAEFGDVSVTVDKYQRSSYPKLVLTWPLMKLLAAWAWRKETKRFKTIDQDNAPLVGQINSLPMLLGRTIIVAARKPSS
ncbi:MAG: ubiquinone/menaquinone biosynthesis C-methylase UbiE [Candidatus Binatia bacterium]|jgi:ubiquinone/menaquinone biosynthesis C-methylase UbiE